MNTEKIIVFLTFFLISLITTLIILFKRNPISNYFKLVDKPNIERKIHKTETPIIASFSIVILFILFLIIDKFYINLFSKNFEIILSISLCFFAVGIIDDKYSLNPYQKIIFISLILFFLLPRNSTLIIDKIFFLDLTSFYYLKEFSTFFTIFCILALMNAMNLVDGINSLATGIVIFAIIYILIFFNNDFNFYLFIVLINLSIISFYIYKGNYFLGNNGILFLSGFLSLIIIEYINTYWNINISKTNWSLNINLGSENILVLFLLPGIDMIRLFFSRILNKKDPFVGDKYHLHHFLINRFNLLQTLFIYFFAMNIIILTYYLLKIKFIWIFLLTLFFYFYFLFKLKNNK